MARITSVGVGVAFGIFATASRAQKPGASALVATVAIDSSRQLLPGAEVVITDLHRVAKSDLFGETTISNVPLGVHTVRVRAFGYGPVEAQLLFRGDSVAATFYVKPVAATLAGVQVSAKRISPDLEHFEARRTMGLGRFLTEGQLDSAATSDFALLMASRFPGLKVVPLAAGGDVVASLRDMCGGDASRIPYGRRGQCTPCVVPVFLDGIDMHDVGYEIIRTWDLAGVEFYTGAQVPAEYRVSGTACGVLVLWSRR